MNLKTPPPNSVSDSYLIGFARGLMATDGCVDKKGQISLCNAEEIVAWCRKNLPRVGFWFQSEYDPIEKYEETRKRCGAYESRRNTRVAFLSRESVSVDDLLLEHHRQNYKRVLMGGFKFHGFGSSRVENVYCAVVPDGHSFTLEGGLVTGNCKFEERWTRRFLGSPVNNWTWDTLLGAHVLDFRKGVTSVKFQALTLLGQASYNDHIAPYLRAKGKGGNTPNRIDEVRLEDLLQYCALDSLLELKISQLQRKRL